MSTHSAPPGGPPVTWSGRFSEPVSETVKRYTASITFDYRLAEFDIQGSLAHAAMLHHVGVLSKDDLTAIQRGMNELLDEIRAAKTSISISKPRSPPKLATRASACTLGVHATIRLRPTFDSICATPVTAFCPGLRPAKLRSSTWPSSTPIR
jgi:hypothetical protein